MSEVWEEEPSLRTSLPAAASTLCYPQLRNNSALAVDFRTQLASFCPPGAQDDADWVALLLGDPHARPTVGKSSAVWLENSWQSFKKERILTLATEIC